MEKSVREQLEEQLLNPFLTNGQIEAIVKKLGILNKDSK